MVIKKGFFKIFFSGEKLLVALAVIGIIIALLGAMLLGNQAYTLFKSGGEKKLVEADTYQAIFLTNDQIYFGKLIDITGDFMVLDDVYYVKLEEQLSADGSSKTTKGRLVRLGESEPHGPENQMIVNRGQVLFWENLSFESQIYQSIQSSKIKRN